MKQVNKNLLYNLLYQIFIFIIPFIITPYVSRSLGVENIGRYAYTNSIVSYFMLATLLGINTYGSREIAKCVGDRKKISYTFLSIYGLQFKIGIVMLVIYNIYILTNISENTLYFLINNILLLSAIIDINWLYFGLEKFKTTISRNIIIKILSLILIILFVKTKQDLWVYILILAATTFLSQLYLVSKLRENVDFVKVKFSEQKKHIKEILILFIPVISYSIYRILDKTMLAEIGSHTELGFYENAEKIINIPISFIPAIGTILIPYMSKISGDKKVDIKIVEEKLVEMLKITYMFLIPMAFGLLVISDDFTKLFLGDEFIKSADIIKLLTPTIIFAGIANVIRTGYLIPFNKNNVYVTSTIIAAIVNIILNLIFIPKFGAIGVCIGTVVAEFSVMAYQIFNTRKELNIFKFIKAGIKYFIYSSIMAIVIYLVGIGINQLITASLLIKLIIQLIVAGLIYGVLAFKDIKILFLGRK